MPPPELVPGAGWGGPTSPDPAGPIGSGDFDDCTVIGRWSDGFQFLTRAAGEVVGVAFSIHGGGGGFHNCGVDYWEFALDGGDFVIVDTMTPHPITGVWGWWVAIPAGLPDGAHEIRGHGYPFIGFPRSLDGPLDTSDAAQLRGEHSFFFYTNENETLRSVQMWIDKDAVYGEGSGTYEDPFRLAGEAFPAAVTALGTYGATDEIRITMKSAGSYSTPNCFTPYDNGRCVILEGNPDLPRTDFVIDTNESMPPRGFQAQHVHLRHCVVEGAVQFLNDGNQCLINVEDVVQRGTDHTTTMSPFLRSQWTLGMIFGRKRGSAGSTGKAVWHSMNTAILEAAYVEGYEVYDIGEDFIRELHGIAVDGYCHDGRQDPPGAHANLYQYSGDIQAENSGIYGLITRAIGIVGEGPDAILIRNHFDTPEHRDLAFVNVDSQVSGNAQILHKARHVLFRYTTFGTNPVTATGGALFIHDDPPDSPATDVNGFQIRCSFAVSFGVSHTDSGTVPAYTVPTGTETWAHNNHFIDNAAGTSNTTGETESALFVDAAGGDRRPKSDGTLAGRVPTPEWPCDANWFPRLESDGAIGAYEVGSVPSGGGGGGGTILWHFWQAGGLVYVLSEAA